MRKERELSLEEFNWQKAVMPYLIEAEKACKKLCIPFSWVCGVGEEEFYHTDNGITGQGHKEEAGRRKR